MQEFYLRTRNGQIEHVRNNTTVQSATIRPDLHTIYWAAGIYEGEGSCGTGGNGSTQVTIGQKDPALLEVLQAYFGGTISKRASHQVNGYQGSEIYSWRISGARSRGFLMTIYQLLTARRKQQIRTVFGLTN